MCAGVEEARVNLASERAVIEVPEGLSFDVLASAVKDAGYGARTETQRLFIEPDTDGDDPRNKAVSALMGLRGVRWVTPDEDDSTAVTVEHYSAAVDASDLRGAVVGAGLRVAAIEEKEDARVVAKEEEERALRMRFLDCLCPAARSSCCWECSAPCPKCSIAHLDHVRRSPRRSSSGRGRFSTPARGRRSSSARPT